MKAPEKQVHPRILALYNRGYTVSSAARQLGCSTPHLWNVLTGNRASAKLTRRVNALPSRHFAESSPLAAK